MGRKSDVSARVREHLTTLHLPTMRTCFEEVAEAARREALSYEGFLLEMCSREAEARRQRRVERLLKASGLPIEKDLASFQRKRLPRTVDQQLAVLLDGGFLDRRENCLVFGNPGSGKTHLLCALGQELIVRHGRSILFSKCSLLVQDLLVAKRDLKLAKLIKRLARFEGLILDDIGYVQQGREEMEVLFTLLAERYERGSVMLTSNLPFSKWEAIFKDPMTTAAAIDRLVHHSMIVELNLTSYRMEQAKRKKDGGQEGRAKRA